MAQDSEKRRGIDEKEMQLNYPKTWSYLEQFDKDLRSRAAYKRYFSEDDPFYSMFDVSEYTFAENKVVWREQASSLTASVIGSYEGKVIIPDHKLMLVDCNTHKEVHYVCAMLNSSPTIFAAKCYAIETQIDTHIIKNIHIPKFDPQDTLHLKLAELSEKAHDLAATGEDKALSDVEKEIDLLAGKLWGLAEDELAEIKKSLDEMS